MKLDDLALLMGKTREELEEILKQNSIIELNLTEKGNREIKDNGSIEVLE
ncbi:unnamed protein product [marine sediment metagenome]|uniref:Uncharacterized protein n=1 Tax=marine sediment metagenome TaxID=412755 RepID=X1TPQ7_9ZZZZ